MRKSHAPKHVITSSTDTCNNLVAEFSVSRIKYRTLSRCALGMLWHRVATLSDAFFVLTVSFLAFRKNPPRRYFTRTKPPTHSHTHHTHTRQQCLSCFFKERSSTSYCRICCHLIENTRTLTKFSSLRTAPLPSLTFSCSPPIALVIAYCSYRNNQSRSLQLS